MNARKRATLGVRSDLSIIAQGKGVKQRSEWRRVEGEVMGLSYTFRLGGRKLRAY